MPVSMCALQLLASVLLFSAVCCTKPDEADAAADVVSADGEDDNPKMPMPPVILSRHMSGSWNVEWHHGCSSYTTPGTAVFKSPSEAWWSHRDVGGELVDRRIAGEGTNLSYIPMLTQMEMPKTGDLRDFAYQLCTVSSIVIPTANRDPNGFLEGMNTTETRVLRGFVGQKISDTFILDRCAGGQNKNYNFFVTTVGQELFEGEEVLGPSSRKFHEVRFQFRLPGKVGCAPETLNHPMGQKKQRKDLPEPKQNVFWNEKARDALVDEGYEIIVFRRSDRGPTQEKGLLDSGSAMFIFACMFMMIRVYTSYRFNRRKLEYRQDMMKGVIEVQEAKIFGGGRKTK